MGFFSLNMVFTSTLLTLMKIKLALCVETFSRIDRSGVERAKK